MKNPARLDQSLTPPLSLLPPPPPALQENDSDCGGTSGLSPSLALTAALQLVLLWVLTGSRHPDIMS